MKIIFLDIDGPLIPLRMWFAGDRPFDRNAGSFIYDPVAVWMVRELSKKFEAKVVFNSAHNENGPERMKFQADCNGFGDVFHKDCITEYPWNNYSRLDAITKWLQEHPETTDWIDIDDVEVHPPRQVRVDYNLGMTLTDYNRACELFGEKPKLLVGFG